MTGLACSQCGTESHPDAGDDFFTCYRCNARLVRRTDLGRGWEVLTDEELQRLRLIDLEWNAERERYKVWDRMGRFVPSVAGSLFWLVAGVGFGGWLIGMGISRAPGPEREQYVTYGLVALVLIGGWSLLRLGVAFDYRRAHVAYRQRRLAAVLSPPQSQGQPPSSSDVITTERDRRTVPVVPPPQTPR